MNREEVIRMEKSMYTIVKVLEYTCNSCGAKFFTEYPGIMSSEEVDKLLQRAWEWHQFHHRCYMK